MSNYYRRFILSYAAIEEPLHQLLHKNNKAFAWTAECDTSFNILKTKLTTPPVLTFPQFKAPFIVATDASDHAIGGVLSQIQDGQEKVVAYWSCQLQKSVKKTTPLLNGRHLLLLVQLKNFTRTCMDLLLTDHNPLTSLKGLYTGGRLARWLLYLQQFNFTFEYKSGASHSNTDTLSRIPPVSENLLTATVDEVSLANPDTLKVEQLRDPELAVLKQHLEQGTVPSGCPPGLRKCFIKDGIICREYKEVATQLVHTQSVVPHSLRTVVLKEVHDHLGHLGVEKTLGHVKTRFYCVVIC